jgi:serine/threonine protein kinase
VSAADATNILVSTPTFDKWNNEKISESQQQSIYKLYNEHKSNGKQLEVTLENGQTYIFSPDSIMIPNDLNGAITFTNVYEKGKFNKCCYNTNGGKIKIKFSPISVFAKREAILLGKLHENLETIHEISKVKFDEKILVIVSSWCDHTLNNVIDAFPPDMTCHQKVLRDLLKGIEYMHSNGIGKLD